MSFCFAQADLIGHWKFDESSGSSATDEVSSNNGSWVPGVDTTPDWRPTEGILGGAIEFPGAGNHQNYFSIAGFSEINGIPDGMTISAWVKPAGTSGYRGILMTRKVEDNIGSGATLNQNYGMADDNGRGEGRVSGGSVDAANGSLPADGNWHHIVWVWDNAAGHQKVYINGVQSGPTQTSSGHPANLQIISNGEWRIADDACCNQRNFNGLMDDLAVWDEPLTPIQVSEIYQNGLAGYAVGETPPPPVTDPLEVGLVINEVHYDPDPKTDLVEFIELLNTNSTALDLSGLTFSNGVSYTFPPGTTLDATSYLILTEDPAELAARYPNIPAGTQIVQHSGSLQNDGETITLSNSSGATIDTVDYQSEFPWPISPNGEGDSMQLINATLDNDLGGAWRGGFPTPGLPNQKFATTAPPVIRQVDHTPKQPLSTNPTVITAKVTDTDGVGSVDLLYQIVTPGNYLPAFLPNSYSTLTSSPSTPQSPNPAFEDPANWTTLAMVDDGTNGDAIAGDTIYTATIPAQAHRTLVRYRIVAEDALAESIRVPYADDPSLNFAYFVYDGVPDYLTHSSATLTALPVYHMITRNADRKNAFAYSSTGDGSQQIPKGNVAARKVFNWECALVFDGEVYDHVGWRLRQRNDRYAGNGKRSLRFKFNRGNYFQALGEDGEKLPVKWRRMNTSKMSRFGGTNSYGLHETMNSQLWRMAGVEAPYFLPGHWRMIDDTNEIGQYNGDFWGFTTVMQDIDGRLLDERDLPDGNMYKLKDGVTNPLELQRNQARTSVANASDFNNVKNNLNSSQSESWLIDHVDWDQWAHYHAVVEAVRHYDYGTPSTHFKNRAWYFMPSTNSLGKLRLIPHDHDASWSKGYHDNLNSVGNSIGTGFPWAAIFGGNTRPPAGPEKANLTRDYRNVIRNFRDLLWQEETVHTLIDTHVMKIQPFTLADQDRWVGGTAADGTESMTAIENIVTPMKDLAFVSDTMYGSNLVGGRGAFLDQIASDPGIPATPTISYSGQAGFPSGFISFTHSAYSDPQSDPIMATEWRIAEIARPMSTEVYYEWNASWIGTTPNTASPPASATRVGSTYRARVRHQDDTGRWSHWSDPLEFTVTIPDLSLFTESLVISEIMYHPADPSPAEFAAGFTDANEFEFIEIRNVGTQTIDLTNVRFTKGIDFDFSSGTITSIAPGEVVLVVENIAAFEMRYGSGFPVTGQWSGQLSNGGEQIKLSYGAGEPIQDFIYDDFTPWPTSADGGGDSLTLVHPYDLPTHGDHFSWQPSSASPGTAGGTTYTSGSVLTYATGDQPACIEQLPDGNLTFTITLNQDASDLSGELQTSTDLENWSEATTFTRTSVMNISGGFAEYTFTSSTPPTNDKLFIRYAITIN